MISKMVVAYVNKFLKI